MKRNYQKELEKIIEQIKLEQKAPTLLLHSCCAPCSSYCLEYLAQHFKITIFYYNPNIAPEAEYRRRLMEQKELISRLDVKYPISFIEGDYDTDLFYYMAKGRETLPEGGERCFDCYRLRLKQGALMAKQQGFDYFTTTLSISPHKNAEKLNEIAEELEMELGIKHLPSDFKKKNGYKRSIELSKEFGLYRQDYCGCIYSKRDSYFMKEEKK